MFCYIELTLT